jgi:hypothetical protein
MPGAFLYDNMIARAFSVNCSTAVASAGVSNLLDPQLRLRMRNVSSTATILVDFARKLAPECVALLSTNIASSAQVRVRLSDSDPTGMTGIVWDSGLLTISTSAECQGQVVVLRNATTAGRYLLVDLTNVDLVPLDVGGLVAGPLWRLTRAQSYGAREGRLIMDRRDRNMFTGAEFPVPALLNPRFVAFVVQNMTRIETNGAHREMTRRLGAAGDALWIPDTALSNNDLALRSIWGAVAQPGDDVAAERTNFVGFSRAWRLIERG